MAIPVDFDGRNATFTGPDCEPLSAYREEGAVITKWQFTDEEMEEIERTGSVWLFVFGGGTPPVFVSGNDPFMEEETDQ